MAPRDVGSPDRKGTVVAGKFCLAIALTVHLIGYAALRAEDTAYELAEGHPRVNPTDANLNFHFNNAGEAQQRVNQIKYGRGNPPNIFTVHERTELDGHVQNDWEFAFTTVGNPPARLRGGDHFEIQIAGQ